MGSDLFHALPSAFDLLSLAICFGALSCRLWVIPPTATALGSPCSEALLASLWRLLAAGMTVLAVSSLSDLGGRAVEMSGLPLSAILPALPTVLFRTHYGRVWLVRPVALAALWIGWWMGKRRLHSRAIPALMLGAEALIALTRSASGHAAEWGDLTLSELMDWLHLLAGLLWGGGLLALSAVVLPAAIKVKAGLVPGDSGKAENGNSYAIQLAQSSWLIAHSKKGNSYAVQLPNERRTLIADIARRFSAFARVALAGVLLTGMYNAWIELRSLQALWGTPYGRMLLAKLSLLLPLLALGASNRYVSVPLLQRWAGRPWAGRRLLHALLVLRYLVTGRRRPLGTRLVLQWRRKVGAEAALVAGVLICTALLLHRVPARHLLHAGHAPVEETEPAGSIRIPMQSLHKHGGVPPGWHLHLPQGEPARGRQVFITMECYACHTVQGESFPHGSRKPGPDLTGMGAHHPDDYFLESILNPNAVIVEGTGYTGPDGRSIMPDYRDLLTAGQLIDLVAYIKSLHEESH